MILQWNIKAWNDYVYWQTQDRRTLKRINDLLRDIIRNPFTGIGKPEPLKGSLSGLWSRRINDADRIVYAVQDDSIIIIACRGHYE